MLKTNNGWGICVPINWTVKASALAWELTSLQEQLELKLQVNASFTGGLALEE
jgi:hypothetical protein